MIKYMFYIFLSAKCSAYNPEFPSHQRPQQLIANKYAEQWKAHLKEHMAKALGCLILLKDQLSH